jgi:hypothetical protein
MMEEFFQAKIKLLNYKLYLPKQQVLLVSLFFYHLKVFMASFVVSLTSKFHFQSAVRRFLPQLLGARVST